jgi:hypothetical protein
MRHAQPSLARARPRPLLRRVWLERHAASADHRGEHTGTGRAARDTDRDADATGRTGGALRRGRHPHRDGLAASGAGRRGRPRARHADLERVRPGAARDAARWADAHERRRGRRPHALGARGDRRQPWRSEGHRDELPTGRRGRVPCAHRAHGRGRERRAARGQHGERPPPAARQRPLVPRGRDAPGPGRGAERAARSDARARGRSPPGQPRSRRHDAAFG